MLVVLWGVHTHTWTKLVYTTQKLRQYVNVWIVDRREFSIHYRSQGRISNTFFGSNWRLFGVAFPLFAVSQVLALDLILTLTRPRVLTNQLFCEVRNSPNLWFSLSPVFTRGRLTTLSNFPKYLPKMSNLHTHDSRFIPEGEGISDIAPRRPR
jgi:hypothetical protein